MRKITLEQLRTIMVDSTNVKPTDFTKDAVAFLTGLATGFNENVANYMENHDIEETTEYATNEMTGLLGLVFMRGYQAGQKDAKKNSIKLTRSAND